VSDAHAQLSSLLGESIKTASNSGTHIAGWAKWIKEKLSFVWFQHPDASAAYSVFMVVNTRGLDLTASELIKAHLLSIVSDEKVKLFEKWSEIEALLRDGSAESDVMTTFVRHVHLLEHGYVINKYLFDDIAREYRDRNSVLKLFSLLDENLQNYLALLNPAESGCDDESFISAANVLKMINVKTARPLLLAMRYAHAKRPDYTKLVSAIASKWVAERISSNVDEPTMAAIAREIYTKPESLSIQIDGLYEKFCPEKEAVLASLKTRPFKTRSQAKFLLCSYDANDALPDFSQFVKAPRRVFGWASGLENVELSYSLDAAIGNWAFEEDELFKHAEDTDVNDAISIVENRASRIADALVEVWYVL